MSKVLDTVLKVALLLIALGALGVSIAVLVTVINNGKTDDTTTTPAPPTVDPVQQAIPAQPVISTSDARFGAYQSFASLLDNWINTTVDPCNDFYGFVCGTYGQDKMSFDLSDDQNSAALVTLFNSPTYFNTASKPMQQMKWYYDKCRAATKDYTNQDLLDRSVRRWNAFIDKTKMKVPAVFPDQKITAPLTPTDLANVLGYGVSQFGVTSLVDIGVDTDWKDPLDTNGGFALLMDQPAPMFTSTVYTKIWTPAFQTVVMSLMSTTFQEAALLFNQTVTALQSTKNANATVNLDYVLATQYDSDEYTRRQYERSYNPMTLGDLNKMYPFLDWTTYVKALLSEQPNLMIDESFRVIVMELDKIKQLNDDYLSGKLDATTVSNYIAYKYLSQLTLPPLPTPPTTTTTTVAPKEVARDAAKSPYDAKMINELKRKHRDGRRIRKDPLPEKIREALTLSVDSDTAQDNRDASCADNTMNTFMWANTRLFVDSAYPTQQDKDNIKQKVGEIVRSILVGFRYQIDILDWMTLSAKKGAYSKIDNLVVNVAYPEWVLNDAQLTAYYAQLTLAQDDSYITMVDKLNWFALYDALHPVVAAMPSDRTDFAGPSAITNAWYQPERNSITFPGGILHQPFWDPNYPASVNYGAMGVIAGHELTHGFDDEGVQWDGTGTLNGWMDANSSASFSIMAQCVINEYDNFCPATLNQCVDGAQTQGENIADNGGIHSAFNAFKAYEAYYGQDPRLPGQWSSFSADQLFFISFAQVWCQQPPDAVDELLQILVDPHSPSLYRVWGTIQNFPEFQAAYNCPVNSPYTPTKHCDVWTSKTTQGSPVDSNNVPAVPPNDVNVRVPARVNPKNTDQYNAYQTSLQMFQSAVNLAVDPCNDFYNYTCGTYHGTENTFYDLDASNTRIINNKLNDPAYQATIKASTALTKVQTLYNACIAEAKAPTINTTDYVSPLVAQLAGYLEQDPPFFGNKAKNVDHVRFANGLAYLSFTLGIDTFITPLIDTYWTNPQGASTLSPFSGYFRHLDQLTAYYSRPYYEDDAWATTKPGYQKAVWTVLDAYSTQQGIPLAANVTDMIDVYLEYERLLVMNFTCTDQESRDYGRQWQVMDITSKDMPFGVDWPLYFSQAPLPAGYDNDTNVFVNFLEFDYMSQMMTALEKYKTDEELANYLFIRLLLAKSNLIPCGSGECNAVMKSLSAKRVPATTGRRRNPNIVARIPYTRDGTDDEIAQSCADATAALANAQGRIYVDAVYPTDDDRKAIKNKMNGVIQNVIDAMKGMLESLDWMTPDTKTKAIAKANGIVKNVAYPDFILDNAQLDAAYSTLDLTGQNYYQMLDSITLYNLQQQYVVLLDKVANRQDFLGQTSVVNAWYQPELNSITFPAGILQAPYFDVNYPAGLNYGGIGVVAGHELTHGFDDEGVQWDFDGTYNPWMDANSTAGFNTMAQCVIDEYNGFCPLDDSYTPHCTNGVRTQGENIADNGGIHSAWRAFNAHLELDGADPLFTDSVFSQFSQQQLYFLNFAEVWCMSPNELTNAFIYKRLMTDPHSLGPLRVLGTLQNIPAFAASYNCPAGSVYYPATHCNVWVPTTTA